MYKFLINCLILITLILVFNLIVFSFAQVYYFEEFKKIPSKEFTSFILSDSHGDALKNNPEIYSVYNFSASSDSYLDMKRKVSFLIENEYNIDILYLTADAHTLSKYREKANNMERSIVYSSSQDYSSIYNYIKICYIEYYFPIFQPKIRTLFRKFLISKILGKRNDIKAHSVKWADLSYEQMQNRALERKQIQFPSDEVSEILKAELLDIIDLCRSNKIKVVGIKYPLSNEYSKLIKDSNDKTHKIFLSKGIEVIDGSKLFLKHNEYFRDQDHLNTTGSKVFLKFLFEKI